MTQSRFESIGAYLPSAVLSTKDLLAKLAVPPSFDLQAITGVVDRRVYDSSADNYEDSFTLACNAARDALSRSSYEAGDLDVIISTSISRSKDRDFMYLEPSFASMLGKELGVKGAVHFDLSNACAGMLSGVYVLDRMIRSGAVRNGMVVSGEHITPISETAVREISEKYDLQFASLSVGDSGAAVIMDRSVDDADKIDYIELMTASEYSDLCMGMPSDQSPGIALYTDNRKMHNESRFLLWTNAQREFLAARGQTFADEEFDFVIHHQFGASAVVYMNALGEKEFGTPMPPALNVVEKYGNTSSTSHFIVLHDHLKDKAVPKGSKILMVPAASGIVTGYVSATITSLEV
ncbi:3-oxoacyl-ACP synthase [Rhodococcus maanshanensis]|uniref:3-oxoacyl-ACP synthase III family protein n=1 Tax=Rhodococcus maanshanensis TaxID=183556 RepID=UPI0022B46E5A|nr:3-oxoacyl-[acyl-carrier-protein] synthase III C-terminal domain-containing protein [Rhodococcus maanshanensis]MCZ4554743.1 3-oxoacyl-ACP synthase [Rhodococcus maanshanensis]